MLIPRYVAGISSIGVMMLGAGLVSGQDYPSKPIRITTAGAGGASDFTSRLVAQGMAAGLGQPVIVDNRTAIIAAELVAKAPPDGYTLTVSGGTMWIVSLLDKVPYDIGKDFSPISTIVRELSIVAVHPSLPVKSIKELIALAKAKPGQLNFSSTALGSTGHLAGELFKSMAGVNIVWVPYKGTGPALLGLMTGEAQMSIADIGSIMPNVKAGRMRALAVTSLEPSALVPGMPTVAGSGLPGYEVVSTTGIFAPAKTPVAIITRLNQELTKALTLPDVKERFFNAAVEIVPSSPEQFGALVKADLVRMGKLIKDAGIKVD